jgi:glutathione-regulated potassium-efflux system protein KefB
MPHEGNLLQAAVVFLLAAVLTVPLAKRLQLGRCWVICLPG